jgi:hypothetical protein
MTPALTQAHTASFAELFSEPSPLPTRQPSPAGGPFASEPVEPDDPYFAFLEAFVDDELAPPTHVVYAEAPEVAWEPPAYSDEARPLEVDLLGLQAPRSAESHAEHLASQLIRRHGWPASSLATLTRELAEVSNNPQARGRLLQALQEGLQPHELEPASDLRSLWMSHPEFSATLRSGHPYTNLSWKGARAILRSRHWHELDISALATRLLCAYDKWNASARLQVEYPSFYYYLTLDHYADFQRDLYITSHSLRARAERLEAESLLPWHLRPSLRTDWSLR